jgi:hypothetical protein
VLGERVVNTPAQDLLGPVREELLSSTKLPMAVEFMAGELRLNGCFAPAFAKLGHYFTPFQAFLIAESENDRSKFDFRLALEVLQREAGYRAAGASPQGLFMFEFECLCRNRLGYDKGLAAMAGDDLFDSDWREWLYTVRRQVGLVDVADLIYARSEHCWNQLKQRDRHLEQPPKAILFGEKEGKIAAANRGKDPLLLFAALNRHLGYPAVPRPALPDESAQILPGLLRRVERSEARLKLLEEELKGGIDITRFYSGKNVAPAIEPPAL